MEPLSKKKELPFTRWFQTLKEWYQEWQADRAWKKKRGEIARRLTLNSEGHYDHKGYLRMLKEQRKKARR